MFEWDQSLLTDLEAVVPGLTRGMHINEALKLILDEILRLRGDSLVPRFVATESGLYSYPGGDPRYLFKGESMEVPDGLKVTRCQSNKR